MLNFRPVAFVCVFLAQAAFAQKAAVSITLASSANPSTLGQSVTLTATLAPSAATGKVTFFDGITPLGIGAISGGKASLTTTLLPFGARALKARYAGDANNQAAASAVLAQKVIVLGQNGFAPIATYSGIGMSRSVRAGDFNEDGIADLVASDFDSNKISVLLGKGDGTFQTPASYVADSSRPASAPNGVVVGDFNGDGHADVAVANGAFGTGILSVLLGNGNGTFRTALNSPAGAYISSMTGADFNGDGIEDLAVADIPNNTVGVLLGNGDGGFRALAAITVTGPRSIAVGDFNGDGITDLVTASGTGVSVLLGKGDGTFRAPATFTAGQGGSSVAVGDFNGDGRADLAVANGTDNNVSILAGNGDGTFKDAVSYAVGANPQSLVTGDFNGDGVADLAVSNATSSDLSVLAGNGDGTFKAAANFNTGSEALGLVVADFNGDGRSDLAAGIYLNSTLGVLLGVPVPGPQIGGVVNGASFANSGLAPGLIFSVGGSGLGPTVGQGAQLDSNGRIATNVSGVQVLVDGTPAPLLFVRQDQINAVAPYAIANKVGSSIVVQVIYNGAMSNTFPVQVVAESPAIFPLGGGQGAIRNQDVSVNGPQNPAARGSIVSIYATGEGALSPPGTDGQFVTGTGTGPVADVTVLIGGLEAQLQFAGSTLFDGFLQVNAIVPAGVVPSSAVPVILKIGGQSSPAGITMAVQ